MPSVHVYTNLESPGSPQFLNQAPPGAQQLSLPALVPQMGHTTTEAMVGVVVGAAVFALVVLALVSVVVRVTALVLVR